MQSRDEPRYPTNNQGTPNLVDLHYAAIVAAQYNIPGQAYLPSSIRGTTLNQAHANYSMDNLAQAFGSANIHGSSNMGRVGAQNSFGANSMNMGFMNGQTNNQLCYLLPDGRYHYPQNMSMSQAGYQNGAYNITPTQAHFLPQGGYQMNQALPNTPTHDWMSSRQTSSEIPELSAPRRNSYSSNEDNGPHTPFYNVNGQTELQPKVSYTGVNSPHQWITPSPESVGQTAYIPITKTSTGDYAYRDLDALCEQHPAIPRPIPAIFSGERGRGTLDKSLSNYMNTTNVYIRGLHPDTTDKMLEKYGERFGDITSAKSMVDQHTGLCKGYRHHQYCGNSEEIMRLMKLYRFGFIKYHNFVDGENCIRGFFHWGYEAKWARVLRLFTDKPYQSANIMLLQVSHNEKLKNLGDAGNTNLYVSNLPADLNEAVSHSY